MKIGRVWFDAYACCAEDAVVLEMRWSNRPPELRRVLASKMNCGKFGAGSPRTKHEWNSGAASCGKVTAWTKRAQYRNRPISVSILYLIDWFLNPRKRSEALFGLEELKFNSHHINVPSNAWSTKCRLIACMSAQIRSNLRDESIKHN
jgi:hypothetical protein